MSKIDGHRLQAKCGQTGRAATSSVKYGVVILY